MFLVSNAQYWHTYHVHTLSVLSNQSVPFISSPLAKRSVKRGSGRSILMKWSSLQNITLQHLHPLNSPNGNTGHGHW